MACKTFKMLLVALLAVFTLGSLAEAAPKKIVRHRAKHSARASTGTATATKKTATKAKPSSRTASSKSSTAAKSRPSTSTTAKSKTAAKRPATTKPR